MGGHPSFWDKSKSSQNNGETIRPSFISHNNSDFLFIAKESLFVKQKIHNDLA
jgi:hypothetical protein